MSIKHTSEQIRILVLGGFLFSVLSENGSVSFVGCFFLSQAKLLPLAVAMFFYPLLVLLLLLLLLLLPLWPTLQLVVCVCAVLVLRARA